MASEPLHESPIPVAAILENATAALFMMDAEHRCTYMNPAAEAMTGFRLDEVRGRVLHELVHHTRPDGRPFPIEDCLIGCTLVSGERAQGEEVFVRPDGSFYEVAYSASLVRHGDEVVGAVLEVRDISERVRADEALRLSEARFRTVADAMPHMVWSTRPDGFHDYFNERWYAFTGLPAGTTDGEEWAGAFHPEDQPLAWARWRHSLATGDVYEIEYRLRHHAGGYRWVLGRAVPVRDGGGRIVRWMGTCTDIHDQKLTQAALEMSESALREADRRKDEFLAMLAHELRNPLAPIATAAAVLQQAPDTSTMVRETSALIARQARHLSHLVDDLLDVSRVTRGLVELDREPLDLRDVASAAVEQVRALVDERGHVLTVALPTLPVPVEADRNRLVQVVANLLNNAAKYSPPGGSIRLRVDTGNAGSAVVEVTDSGIGIEPALLSHVFGLFVQGDRNLDRRQGGLGIGLALVRRIVELHGGEVRAESDGVNQGSRFRIALPLAMQALPAPRPPAAAVPDPARPLTIVLVDDNADALQTLALLLELAGHRVHAFGSAGAALEAAHLAVDALVLDIGLPDLSGYELVRRLRRMERHVATPIFALTGYGQPADAAAAREAGFDAHFVKPLEPARLFEALATPGRADRASPHGSTSDAGSGATSLPVQR